MNDIYSFYQLISKYQIEVPIIQRDYAQGRNNAKTADIRKSIISSFVKAVQVEDSLPLFLDFVYGRIEGNKFIPFDGQQRLTTLFLFHKYIFEQCQSKSICYHKDHCICKDILRRFSYATRQSSREFCQLLVEKNIIPEKSIKISDNIINQSWFFPDWKKDPTIMGMMTMLDEIHFQLREEQDFRLIAERLTSGCNCPITFHFVDMGEHKLSDETYVKMNARGKNLTPFENFKASLEQYLDEKQETVLLNRFKGKYDEAKKEYSGVDGIWLNLFWDELNSGKDEKELPDSRMMSFFNRHFMNVWRCWYAIHLRSDKERKVLTGQAEEIQKNHDDFNDRITKIPLYPSKDDFVSWDIYQHILDNCGVDACLNPIFNILDILCEDSHSIKNHSQAVWNRINDNKNKWNLFQGYINNINNRETYPSRVAFFALLNYYRENEGLEKTSLSQWMRIVWNIIENSTIDSPETYAAALRLINELSEHSHNIYVFLSDDKSVFVSDHAKVQVKEEIAKAKQILAEDGSIRKYDGLCKNKDGESFNTWEDVIIEAEQFAFFKGAISFLYHEKEEIRWRDFDSKFNRAKTIFYEKGINDEYLAETLTCLYSYCDNWETQLWWSHKIFNGLHTTWKENILTFVDRSNNYVYALPVHHILMGDAPKTVIDDNRIKKLANQSLVSYLLKKNENKRDMYIRSPHDALYFCGDKQGVMLSNDFRDASMSELLKDTRFSLRNPEIQIPETSLLWGLDIDFMFSFDDKLYFLRWYREHNNQAYDIYLMDEDWSYMKRQIILTDALGDQRNYYCFNLEENNDVAEQIMNWIKEFRS